MASPPPPAPAVELEVRDAVVEHEVKPETNGHLPDASETEPPAIAVIEKVEVEKPEVNGNGDDVANGVHVTEVKTEVTQVETKTAADPAEISQAGEKPNESATVTTDAKEPEDTVKPIAPSEDEEMKDITPDPTAAPVVSTEEVVRDGEKSPTPALPTPKAEPLEEVVVETVKEPATSSEQDIPMGGTTSEPTKEETSAADDNLPASEADLGPTGLSQLAIETTEADTSPIDKSAEVSMTELPVKVAREREDDATEEPAPKRARTEPKEEEAAPSTDAADAMDTTSADPAPLESIEAAPADLNSSSSTETINVASLDWEDKEKDAAVISPYQRREIRKAIGKSKKTKSGGMFRDSVQKFWPNIWDSYVAKIEKPMDLGLIDRELRSPDGPYKVFGDVKQDLGLIFTNTLAYNGPTHDVTVSALNAVRTVWNEIKVIPEGEPAKPKPFAKAKPVREARAALTAGTDTGRRQSSGPPAPTVAAASPQVAEPAAKPGIDARRDSIADADRPKRTVRAPKPKDIDYTTKSRKKLKPELQFADEVLSEVTSTKYFHMNQWFLDRVDAEGLGIPNYYNVIKKPMDFGKVSQLLHTGEINSLKEFDKNVRLIFDNCFQFNGGPDQGNAVSAFADSLKSLYEKQMKQKDSWLAKHAKANAPASNHSDEEEEDEEEDEVEDGPASAELAAQVTDLEAKMREEMTKLNDLYVQEHPNQSLITLQQSIVTVVQKSVLDMKTKLAESRQKPEKTSKASKAKGPRAKGAGSKKAVGAAGPKKPAGGKKAAKKALNAGEKDQIANAINDLEGNHLDRAIDIIKHDTGQNENPEGELELDIDQLSPAALLKLWELCKKVLPGFGKGSGPSAAAPAHVDKAAKQSSKNAAPKGKKNKPMSAQEQEARIAQLEALSSMYKGGRQSEGGDIEVSQGPMSANDSSDESSSEEE